MCFSFYHFSCLRELNIPNINAENVINMRYIFYRCESINHLSFFNFNTKNSIDMNYELYVW